MIVGNMDTQASHIRSSSILAGKKYDDEADDRNIKTAGSRHRFAKPRERGDPAEV
jgi:hypothetical protein